MQGLICSMCERGGNTDFGSITLASSVLTGLLSQHNSILFYTAKHEAQNSQGGEMDGTSPNKP